MPWTNTMATLVINESVFFFSQKCLQPGIWILCALIQTHLQFYFFLLLTCSQRKPISLSSSSDFGKSKHPIARGGFTLPLITETLLWNTICFQKSREVKDKNKWQLLKACEESGDWYSLASELGQENTLVKMLPRIML